MNTKPRPLQQASRLLSKSYVTDTEEVRRRWVRQNRELALENTKQKRTFRLLELECSSLLSDNLRLREENTTLRRDVHKASTKVARQLRDELKLKLTEISLIVDSIDIALQQEDADEELRLRLLKEESLDREYPERRTLTGGIRETQLPVILDESLYPRESLESAQGTAVRLSDSSGGSPDLGPPPVARLNCEDPVKSASPLQNKTLSFDALPTAEEELPSDLSVNLETRRKKRLESRRQSMLPLSPKRMGEEQSSTAARTGAKRKISDRDLENGIKPPSGDFTFVRRASRTAHKGSDSEAEKTVARCTEKSEAVIPPAQMRPSRKVLADKSTNLSPRKPSVVSGKPEKLNADKDKQNHKSVVAPARRRISIAPEVEEIKDVIHTIEIPPSDEMTSEALADLPPITPAASDFFSPTPSEPSAKAETVRSDTPPPQGLATLRTALDGSGASSRPSRRARSAVNYAEPSLTAKMRRPDEKMVDAVSGLQSSRRAVVGQTQRSDAVDAGHKGDSSKQQSGSRRVSVDDEDRDWGKVSASAATDPSSPLSKKSSAAAQEDSSPPKPPIAAPILETESHIDGHSVRNAKPESLPQSRKRRHSTQQPLSAPRSLDHIIARPTSPRSRKADTLTEVASKLEDLDIYDFTDSSPAAVTKVKSTSSLGDTHRRSLSASSTIRVGGTSTPPEEAASMSRRHSSAQAARDTGSRNRATANSSGASSISSTSKGSTGTSKLERVGSGGPGAAPGGRRRSTMV